MFFKKKITEQSKNIKTNDYQEVTGSLQFLCTMASKNTSIAPSQHVDIFAKVATQMEKDDIKRLLQVPTMHECCREIVFWNMLQQLMVRETGIFDWNLQLYSKLFEVRKTVHDYISLKVMKLIPNYLRFNRPGKEAFIEGFYQLSDHEFELSNMGHFKLARKDHFIQKLMDESFCYWNTSKNRMGNTGGEMPNAQPTNGMYAMNGGHTVNNISYQLNTPPQSMTSGMMSHPRQQQPQQMQHALPHNPNWSSNMVYNNGVQPLIQQQQQPFQQQQQPLQQMQQPLQPQQQPLQQQQQRLQQQSQPSSLSQQHLQQHIPLPMENIQHESIAGNAPEYISIDTLNAANGLNPTLTPYMNVFVDKQLPQFEEIRDQNQNIQKNERAPSKPRTIAQRRQSFAASHPSNMAANQTNSINTAAVRQPIHQQQSPSVLSPQTIAQRRKSVAITSEQLSKAPWHNPVPNSGITGQIIVDDGASGSRRSIPTLVLPDEQYNRLIANCVPTLPPQNLVVSNNSSNTNHVDTTPKSQPARINNRRKTCADVSSKAKKPRPSDLSSQNQTVTTNKPNSNHSVASGQVPKTPTATAAAKSLPSMPIIDVPISMSYSTPVPATAVNSTQSVVNIVLQYSTASNRAAAVITSPNSVIRHDSNGQRPVTQHQSGATKILVVADPKQSTNTTTMPGTASQSKPTGSNAQHQTPGEQVLVSTETAPISTNATSPATAVRQESLSHSTHVRPSNAKKVPSPSYPKNNQPSVHRIPLSQPSTSSRSSSSSNTSSTSKFIFAKLLQSTTAKSPINTPSVAAISKSPTTAAKTPTSGPATSQAAPVNVGAKQLTIVRVMQSKPSSIHDTPAGNSSSQKSSTIANVSAETQSVPAAKSLNQNAVNQTKNVQTTPKATTPTTNSVIVSTPAQPVCKIEPVANKPLIIASRYATNDPIVIDSDSDDETNSEDCSIIEPFVETIDVPNSPDSGFPNESVTIRPQLDKPAEKTAVDFKVNL